jgi:hypothetical protein
MTDDQMQMLRVISRLQPIDVFGAINDLLPLPASGHIDGRTREGKRRVAKALDLHWAARELLVDELVEVTQEADGEHPFLVAVTSAGRDGFHGRTAEYEAILPTTKGCVRTHPSNAPFPSSLSARIGRRTRNQPRLAGQRRKDPRMTNTDAKLTATALVELAMRADGQTMANLLDGLDKAELGAVTAAMADMVVGAITVAGRDPADALNRWRAELLKDGNRP